MELKTCESNNSTPRRYVWVCVITGLYLLEHLRGFIVTAALIVLPLPTCVS